ncbi:MAG: rhodanese-like domain-containing protein [Rhodobacteraceae bacterium]|nr:rhodanese-like domain-containing protein [Paracoccaceae bacterium]
MTQSPTNARGTISRRSLLIGGLALVGALAGGAWWRRQAPDYDGLALSVSQAHAQAARGEIILIDIRTPREWRATGLGEHARPVDMRREDFVQALQKVVGGDTAAPIALICARGVRSARLSLRLTEVGFTNIIDVPEGMLGSGAGPGWLRAGLPLRDWNEDQS